MLSRKPAVTAELKISGGLRGALLSVPECFLHWPKALSSGALLIQYSEVSGVSNLLASLGHTGRRVHIKYIVTRNHKKTS